MSTEHTQKSSGFTLIEVSIVLVIIGLITAGVLVGRDLIRQAELRSVMTDVERYNTAVNTFRAKYNCLPGDCVNATDFFGTQTAGGGCPYPTVTTDTSTCNGNGSGEIWSASEITNFIFHEKLRFWQHLSAAGLLPTMSGIGDTSFGDAINLQAVTFGYNAPATKLTNTGITVFHDSALNTFGFEYFKPLTGRHMMILGTTDVCNVTSCIPRNDAIAAAASGTTPENAFMLDNKIDDGKPGQGAVYAPPNDGGYGSWFLCTTGDHTQASTAAYRLDITTPVCPVFFQTTF